MLRIATLRSMQSSRPSSSSTARLTMARAKSKSRTKEVGKVLLSARLSRNLNIAQSLKMLNVQVRRVKLKSISRRSEVRTPDSSPRKTSSNLLRPHSSSLSAKTVKPNSKLLHNQMRLLKLSKRQPLRPRSSNVRCARPSSRRRSS